MSRSNRRTLADLFARDEIDIRDADVFQCAPDDPRCPSPVGPGFDFDRAEGMLLGVAIGDALGGPTEGMLPGERQAVHGEVRDYLPTPRADDRPVGVPTDDTQLTFRTLEQMVHNRHFRPGRVSRHLAAGPIHEPGEAVRTFLRASAAGDVIPWHRRAVKSAGSGATMRISPIVLPHLDEGGSDLYVDAALAAAITHNDSAAIASSMGFAALYHALLGMDAVPEPRWWPTTFVERIRGVERDPFYRSRSPHLADFKGTLADLVEEHVMDVYTAGHSARSACDYFFSGAYLFETVPCALSILMRHAEDPEEAVVRAVNDTRDSDTIAALVGAAVGALHGVGGLPERWIRTLTGRLDAHDDGRVFELVEEARLLWGKAEDVSVSAPDDESGTGSAETRRVG